MKISLLSLPLLITLTFVSNAEKYTPASADSIIAKWPINLTRVNKNTKISEKQAIELTQNYLHIADQIGQSHLYNMAQITLKPFIKENSNNEIWILWAKIQQHKHYFNQAIETLNKVIATEPKNTNANLMLANIYIIQSKYDLAKSACIKLLGQTDLTTSSICLLEVTSYQGKLQESYNQLVAIKNNHKFKQNINNWLILILSDMAIRLDQYQESEKWLASNPKSGNISYISHWADVKLKLNKPLEVISKLQPMIENLSSVEDTLLLKLAQSEVKINQLKQSNNDKWQNLMHERVKLRESRQDKHHASDLALYYLEINYNPEKALSWAEINWSQAQLPADLNLLNRAKSAFD